jgi:hypothetical protein
MPAPPNHPPLSTTDHALALALAVLSVIPSRNLLLPLPLPLFLKLFVFRRHPEAKPKDPRIGRCTCLSFCHSLWESAASFVFAFAFAIVLEIGPGFSPDIKATTSLGFSPRGTLALALPD